MDELNIKTLQWLPASGEPEQLMLLWHGIGANAADMTQLGRLLQREFPQAAVMAFDGLEPLDGDPSGLARQWYRREPDITDEQREARIQAILPTLADAVTAAQQAVGIAPQATALVGFSQGAGVALALAHARDGIAGRVLSFSGRYGVLPDTAPQLTTLHFFHGEQDEVVPVTHARAAIGRLSQLGADATVDIANNAGHEINGALFNQAIFRLRNHIPQRSWAAAMGAASDPS